MLHVGVLGAGCGVGYMEPVLCVGVLVTGSCVRCWELGAEVWMLYDGVLIAGCYGLGY